MTTVVSKQRDVRRGQRLAITIGLLVAVVAGIAGGGFDSVSLQTVLYAASSLGWVVATSVLALDHHSRGQTLVAAGFLVLTIAETLLWVNGRPGDPAYEAGFAGGAMFYVPGLLMIGLPAVYSLVVRVLAVVAGGVWSVWVAAFLVGSGFSSTGPLALTGYVLLSAAFVGVAVTALRDRTGGRS